MPMLHDAAFREQARKRVSALTPHSVRQWGKMTVDQMRRAGSGAGCKASTSITTCASSAPDDRDCHLAQGAVFRRRIGRTVRRIDVFTHVMPAPFGCAFGGWPPLAKASGGRSDPAAMPLL